MSLLKKMEIKSVCHKGAVWRDTRPDVARHARGGQTLVNKQ